jgi:lysophospholipase L1-like esterase
MVVMGESNAYGMNAVESRNQWVQVLGDQIRTFQDGPLRIFNNAIPSNVISPAAPGYVEGDLFATAPSAIERYQQDMIGYAPDLAVFAYGLNDSRCGHAVDSFITAYEEIVRTTKARCPETLIVLVGPYWNLQYDAETWADPSYTGRFGKFGVPGDALVRFYNSAIFRLAAEYDVLFVDLYTFLEGSTWLLTDDACHFSDVGQHLIGQHVFGLIASRCSFLSHTSRLADAELRSSVWTTGGTDALPDVVKRWRTDTLWKGSESRDDW